VLLIIEVLILGLRNHNILFSSSLSRKVVVLMQGKDEAPAAKNTVSWVYREEGKNEPAPWGPHSVPVLLRIDGVDIFMESGKSGYHSTGKAPVKQLIRLFYPVKAAYS